MVRSKRPKGANGASSSGPTPATATMAEVAGSPAGEGLTARLDQLQAILLEIQARLAVTHIPEKEAFTPGEFAALAGLSTYTVQDHCRRGRVRATKALSGRGGERGWRISADELKRYQREGLLPGDHPAAAQPTLPPREVPR